MAIQHATSGQPIALFGSPGQAASAQTTSLFKTYHLEVIRLVLPKGKAFPPHKVAGDITVQCLAGRPASRVEEAGRDEVQRQELSAGEMLYLAGGVRHGLVGLDD